MIDQCYASILKQQSIVLIQELQESLKVLWKLRPEAIWIEREKERDRDRERDREREDSWIYKYHFFDKVFSNIILPVINNYCVSSRKINS